MERKIYAEISVDEEIIKDKENSRKLSSYGPLDFLTEEFELMKGSGIKLKNAIVSDEDDTEPWGRYIDYVISWAFVHSWEEQEYPQNMTYNEWKTKDSMQRFVESTVIDADKRILNSKSNGELEYVIREIYSENGFEFTEDEWNVFSEAGYDKLDVAKLCCECAVLVDVECYDRYMIVAWSNGPSEDSILGILNSGYEQWVDVDKYPDAESYCCEEYMLKRIDTLSFEYSVIYGDYTRENDS